MSAPENIKNRVCDLFSIKYPIIQGGMVWCAGWELASAVSHAGGLGIIGSGSMYPEILRDQIKKCKEATSLGNSRLRACESFLATSTRSTGPDCSVTLLRTDRICSGIASSMVNKTVSIPNPFESRSASAIDWASSS